MYTIIQPDKATVHEEDTGGNRSTTTIFLAGTIEMGAGVRWQAEAARRIHQTLLAKTNDRTMPALEFYNPRRDADFTPEMAEPQIRWEQERLIDSDYIFMYLQPDTKSPISLLEFGQFIGTGKLYLSCSHDFYRYSNLIITAEYSHARDHVLNNIDDCIEAMTDAIVRQWKTEGLV